MKFHFIAIISRSSKRIRRSISFYRNRRITIKCYSIRVCRYRYLVYHHIIRIRNEKYAVFSKHICRKFFLSDINVVINNIWEVKYALRIQMYIILFSKTRMPIIVNNYSFTSWKDILINAPIRD